MVTINSVPDPRPAPSCETRATPLASASRNPGHPAIQKGRSGTREPLRDRERPSPLPASSFQCTAATFQKFWDALWGRRRMRP